MTMGRGEVAKISFSKARNGSISRSLITPSRINISSRKAIIALKVLTKCETGVGTK